MKMKKKEKENEKKEEENEESKGFNKEAFINQITGKMEDKYEKKRIRMWGIFKMPSSKK